MEESQIVNLIIMVAIAVAFAIFVSHIAGKQDEVEKHKKMIIEKKEEYDRMYKETNGIPEDASILCCTSEENWNVFAWEDNNILNFCGTYDLNGVRKILIPIEDIQFFTRDGDHRTETATEGGDISVGKAIIGGLIGGIIGGILVGTVGFVIGLGVGALLTGRNKVTTINREIDNRKTYLNYIENNENKRMTFTSKDYNELLNLIPEKEMSYIQNNKIVESNSQNDIYKDIEKLSELKDKGILSEDEFNDKKQLLLDKIQ